jgi:HK97 family phage prohead protease
MERKINKKSKSFETKNIEGFEIKSIDEAGRFYGYASVFNLEDSFHDVILPKAFAGTLERKSNIGREIKLLWQHSPEKPIGVFDKIEEDSVGLYVEGRILMDVEKGREAYALMKSGAISGLSIGYSVKNASIDKNTGVRTISEIDLFEISVVTFPANKYANITYIKSKNLITETKEYKSIERALDKAARILLTD